MAPARLSSIHPGFRGRSRGRRRAARDQRQDRPPGGGQPASPGVPCPTRPPGRVCRDAGRPSRPREPVSSPKRRPPSLPG
ncbi:MAG: hypothetical protein C3F10_04805 [Dehalococcoidia bacterium]|nr:MAG: hypothetical protein C3F10_04805 [Dehalococcoidia bacterium]